MLDQFVVSSEREGNAKAIMEQKNSMNITNSIASDAFGDVAEGNAAEFLKNIPGVDLWLVQGEIVNVRLRGLGSEYNSVTIDGVVAVIDAGVALVLARPEGAPAGTKGLSLFVLPRVLPDGLAGTREIMEFLAQEISPRTYVNVMGQYRPCGRAGEHPSLRKFLTALEHEQAQQMAREAGLTRLDRREKLFRWL